MDVLFRIGFWSRDGGTVDQRSLALTNSDLRGDAVLYSVKIVLCC